MSVGHRGHPRYRGGQTEGDTQQAPVPVASPVAHQPQESEAGAAFTVVDPEERRQSAGSQEEGEEEEEEEEKETTVSKTRASGGDEPLEDLVATMQMWAAAKRKKT